MLLKRKKLKLILIAILLLLPVLIVIFLKNLDHNFEQPMPVAVIRAATVNQQKYTPTISLIGNVKAESGVNVTTERGGIVNELSFRSGQLVKKGQVLLTLRNHDVKAKLQQSIAKMNQMRQQYLRYKQLLAEKSVSQSTYDTSRSQYLESLANVAYAKSVLSQTIIKAPFSGQLGIRKVSLGQYVSPGSIVTSLQSMRSLYVDFNVPEQYAALIHKGSKVQLTTSFLTKPVDAKVIALSSQVSLSTRTIPVRAKILLSGSQHGLLPGMFVEVKADLKSSINVITVPQTAISYQPFGEYVYVIVGNRVKMVPVKVGTQIGNKIIIESGLKAGEKVVSEGQIKLHSGSKIQVASPILKGKK